MQTLKRGCDLSNEELIQKCIHWVSDLCKSGGRAWTLRVPVDMDRDPDILFTELIQRYQSMIRSNLFQYNEIEIKTVCVDCGSKIEMGRTCYVCIATSLNTDNA